MAEYEAIVTRTSKQMRERINKCAITVLEYISEDSMKKKYLAELEGTLVECVKTEYSASLASKAAKEARERVLAADPLSIGTEEYEQTYNECLNSLNEAKSIQEVIDNAPSVKAFREQLQSAVAPNVRKEDGDSDDSQDIVATEEEINIIDPISKKVMTEPVRNKHCGHVYDRVSAEDQIKAKGRAFRCPAMGCTNRAPIKRSDLEAALDVQREIVRRMEGSLN